MMRPGTVAGFGVGATAGLCASPSGAAGLIDFMTLAAEGAALGAAVCWVVVGCVED